MSKGSEPFEGTIGRTYEDSEPWWPEESRPRKASPNVVVILLDDTGFAHFGCYGSTIDTPNVDGLAENGLRFTNFHTTALCSPSRACLLTGRNHHSVGMRALSNFDTGYPNMRGAVTNHAATLAEQLREHGYATLAVGKWHLAPMRDASAAGPHDQWPLQRGFDRYYGFLQGETDQFRPELTYDNHPVAPPRTPEDGYHLSEDLVDRSISFVRDLKSVRPDRPFFLYLAFGATHSPHQAPRAYVEKYRGRFDAGWDRIREEWFERQKSLGVVPEGTQLAPRNPGVKPWDELSENEKRFALRLQEAFAGFLDHTDTQIGRLLAFLEELGEMDDTLIFLLSDNGASQEGGPGGVMDEFKYFNLVPENVDEVVQRLDDIGGPHSHTNYPWGWAQAGNTPLKWYKQNTFGGGVRDPLIVAWRGRIKDRGGTRNQFHHVTDIVPTILEELGIEPPASVRGYEQMPIHGTSMSYTLDDADAAGRKTVQYFEMFGHRGIWLDGWKAVSYHRRDTPYGDDEWELYHLDEDFSETRNLAVERPDKLRELIDRWWVEAGKHGVLPLDDRNVELFGGTPRPDTPHAHRDYVYYPPIAHLPADASPRLGARSWQITAEIERPDGRCEGVLLAQGTHNTGLTFYVKDNKLVFDYNYFTSHTVVTSGTELPTGRCSVGVRFVRRDQSGEVTLLVDGSEAGQAHVPRILRMLGSTGLDVGRDSLSPVTEDYEAPFEFTGTIHKITFNLLRREDVEAAREAAEAEARTELARE